MRSFCNVYSKIFKGHFGVHRGFASRGNFVFTGHGRRAVDVTGPHSKRVQRCTGRNPTKSVIEIRRRNEGQTEKRDDVQMVASTRHTP